MGGNRGVRGGNTANGGRRRTARRRVVPLIGTVALLTGGLIVAPQLSQIANAASFVQVPERLYMTPAGVTVPNLIANAAGVKVGTLEFDGSTDPISQDVRTIEVSTVTGDAGCDLTVAPRNIDDCSRVQIGPISHGRLWLGDITAIPDGGGPGITAYMLPNNVRIDNDYQVAAGSFQIGINGEPNDLNAVLANLRYTPDPGYYYEGSNGETVNIALVPGNSDDPIQEPTTINDSASISFEIRVLDINDFPTVTGPGDKVAQPGVELLIPPVAPDVNPPFTGSEFTVTDADNDEDVDGAQANPPVAEDPLQDGAGNSMLLVGYLDCGTPTVDGVSGFSLRGGTFQINNNDIRAIVRDFFDFTQLPQAGQDAITTFLDAVDVVQPGLTTLPLATNNPTTPTHLFAGIGSMREVQYALSQITFLQPAQNDTCTMWTIVSDLGNNGLPIQYFGSPPTGIEVPMIGLAIDSFDITTGALTPIDVSFVTPNIAVAEPTIGTPATAQIRITPATHPPFQIRWDAVPGTATANSDYQGTSNNTLLIGEDVEFIPVDLANVLPAESPIQTNVFPDDTNEGPETFTYQILPGQFTPPPGYTITSDVPTATVTIVDDDDPPNTVAIGDASVVEGDAPGTTILDVPVTLSGPADGNESVTLSTSEIVGGATSGVDFTAASNVVVNFALGETQKLVPITVIGDNTQEPSEQFLVTITSNVSVTDGTATATIVDDDGPEPLVSINDVSTNEGNSGTTAFTFTVSLGTPAAGGETVGWSTANGTATQPGDYTQVPVTTLTFAAGETTKQVVVQVNGDTAPEPNESFLVNLTSPVGLVLADAQGQGTIVNDDSNPAVSIADASLVEGNAGTSTMTFTLSLNQAAGAAVTVDVDDLAVSASEPGDYTFAGPQTVSFAAGDTSKTVDITVVGDTVDELDETFTLSLSNATGGLTVADGSATGTIFDDDVPADVAPPTVTINQAVTQVDPTSLSPIVFTVTFSEPVTGFVTGDVLLSGTALPTTALVTPVSSTVYSVAVSGMSVSGTVIASVGAGVAIDAANNPSLASTSTDNEVQFNLPPADVTPPTVTIDQAVTQVDPTSVSPVVFTVTFSEPVTGFVTGDVLLSGTALPTTGLVTPVSESVYSVAVSGMSVSGTVIANVGAGVAIDAGNNPSLASTSTDNEVQFNLPPADVTPPTVTIDQAVTQVDPTSVSPVVFTVTFSEPVTGFVTGDVLLSGTALPTTGLVTPVSSTVYTVAVSGMSVSGTVIASVGAGVAVDAANNPSAASTSTDNEVQFNLPPPDNTAPTVTVDQAVTQVDPTSVSPVVFTVTFSEPVTGFVTGDVLLSGTALPTTGLVTPVSSTVYTVAVSGMSVSGTVIASVGAGVAVDAANNPSAASTSTDNTVQFNLPAGDVTPPTVTINQAATQVDPTSASPIVFTVVFSETVTGFVTGDVLLSGTADPSAAVVTPVAGNVYSVAVSGMTQSGTVIASVGAGVAVDAANNPNVASTSTDNTVQYDALDEPLALNLPPNQTANNDPGQAGAIVAYPTVTATGGLPPVFVNCSPISGAFFPLGTTTVSCTATDSEPPPQGEFQDALVFGTFTVTVIDNEPPVIADNPDLTRETVANTPVVVTFGLPAASDNSGVPPTVVCTPASGSTFVVGTSTVTCTATDGAGNSASSSFTVTVTSTGSGVPGPTTVPPTTAPPATNPITGLPATGSDPRSLVLAALLLLAGGAVLVRSARRRTT